MKATSISPTAASEIFRLSHILQFKVLIVFYMLTIHGNTSAMNQLVVYMNLPWNIYFVCKILLSELLQCPGQTVANFDGEHLQTVSSSMFLVDSSLFYYLQPSSSLAPSWRQQTDIKTIACISHF